MGAPAWKNLPTWYAVAENDEVIPPDVERLFANRMGATTTELVSGHVGMISHPDEVAGLIQTAGAVRAIAERLLLDELVAQARHQVGPDADGVRRSPPSRPSVG